MIVLIVLLYLAGFVTLAHWWRGSDISSERCLQIDLRDQPAPVAPDVAPAPALAVP